MCHGFLYICYYLFITSLAVGLKRVVDGDVITLFVLYLKVLSIFSHVWPL